MQWLIASHVLHSSWANCLSVNSVAGFWLRPQSPKTHWANPFPIPIFLGSAGRSTSLVVFTEAAKIHRGRQGRKARGWMSPQVSRFLRQEVLTFAVWPGTIAHFSFSKVSILASIYMHSTLLTSYFFIECATSRTSSLFFPKLSFCLSLSLFFFFFGLKTMKGTEPPWGQTHHPPLSNDFSLSNDISCQKKREKRSLSDLVKTIIASHSGRADEFLVGSSS